jgi:arylsulfatase A-like enzyme
VPMVIGGPGIPKNKRSDAFVYTFDLFPTLCNLAGIQIPDTVDGQSLLPLLKGERKQVRESTFHAYRNFQRAVRTKDWKLIRYTVDGKETIQLFHLTKDPWETRNLADNPSYRQQLQRLSSELKDWQNRVGDPLA